MRLTEDQAAVEEFAAQRADQAFANRVHPRRLDSGAQDGGAGGLEDSIKGSREVRVAVADQEPGALEALTQVQVQVAGLLHGPVAGRWAVTPPRCIRRLSCSMNTRT
jgi:hypothetical protein